MALEGQHPTGQDPHTQPDPLVVLHPSPSQQGWTPPGRAGAHGSGAAGSAPGREGGRVEAGAGLGGGLRVGALGVAPQGSFPALPRLQT